MNYKEKIVAGIYVVAHACYFVLSLIAGLVGFDGLAVVLMMFALILGAEYEYKRYGHVLGRRWSS